MPAYIERSADLRRAVNDIVLSKSFDNGMICASEQAVILDEAIHDTALAEFRALKAHIATPCEKAMLEHHLFGVGEGASCAEGRLNTAVVGKPAAQIAEAAGFTLPADTSVILVQADRVGPSEPLTREKLCPVLAVLCARDRGHGSSWRSGWSSARGWATPPPCTPGTRVSVRSSGTRSRPAG